MKSELKFTFVFLLIGAFLYSCTRNSKEDVNGEKKIMKGLYVFGPELRSFTDCKGDSEYWVIDSAYNLELSYSKFNFEKPYEPVYVEMECFVKPSDTTYAADFDSTLVVTKLLKISKNIPDGPCSNN